MTLLRQIQEDATSAEVETGTILRKCRVLASRLDNAPFEEWIRHESDGYPPDAQVPPYRMLRTRLHGDFCGSFGSGLNNVEIRAAVYLVRSRIWPYAADSMCRRFRLDPAIPSKIEAELRVGQLTDETRESLSGNPWPFAGVDRQVLLSYVRSLEARVPPLDEFALWRPGIPMPEGHRVWKAGETTLVRRDEPESPAKPKRARGGRQKTAKVKKTTKAKKTTKSKAKKKRKT